MTYDQLIRHVAYATGESRHLIRLRGFHLTDPATVEFDPEPARTPRYIDWDEVDANRVSLFP